MIPLFHQGSANPAAKALPVSEGRAPAEEHSFCLWLRLVKKSKKSVVFHTNLPEVLTLISATQQEF
jgi:hypothetical protein